MIDPKESLSELMNELMIQQDLMEAYNNESPTGDDYSTEEDN